MKLTQEQLAALIAKVFANLSTKFTEAGKSLNDITTEDILAELSTVVAEMEGDDPTTDPAAAADPDAGKAAEGSDELINKIVAALGTLIPSGDDGKSAPAAGEGEGKSAPAAGEGKGAAGPSATGEGKKA